MANKELTAKVKLNIGDAESKLKRLGNLIKNIDKAISGKSSGGGLDAALNKQLMQQEKLQKLTAQRQTAEEKLAQTKFKTSQMEDAYVDKIVNKELAALQKKQQAQWKSFQAEQIAYDKQIAKAEQLKQKELEKERIRQQSLKTLGQGDMAAQRLAASAEKQARAEYEAWWAAQCVKMEWQKSHPVLARLQSGWDKINSKIQQAVSSSPRLSSAYDKVTTKLGQIKTKVSEWFKTHLNVENSAKRINTQYSKSGSLLSMVTGKLKGLISTYLGVMGMKAIINTSDMITSAENKLNYVSAQQLGSQGTNADGSYSTATIQATQQAMDKMYASSQKVRMGYTDMMSNVSKSMALAGNAFDNSTDKAIRFQEIMAEAYAIGGASAQEMSSSMYQLIQALGAGTLAGDELRSVREGAPLAYKAIEEFAQKTLNCTDSLKDMASQGKITADMVTAAIMNAGNDMDKAFAQTKYRFEDVWTQIKNAAIYAFKPISEMLRTALNDAIDSGLLQKVETVFSGIAKGIMIAFAVIGKVIQWVANIINTAITWIADNWNWLKYVIGGVALFIALYFLPTLLTLIYTAIWGAIKWIAHIIAVGLKFMWMHRVLIIIVVAIMLLIWVFNQFRNGAISGCQAIALALLIVGVAIGVVMLLFGNLWGLVVIGAAIAAYFIITKFSEVCQFLGWLAGWIVNIVFAIVNFIIACVYSLLTFIWNVIALIVNLVMGCGHAIVAIAHNVVAALINVGTALFNSLSAIAQNIGIAFQNAWIWAKNTFWEFIADVLRGVSKLEPVINGIASLVGKGGVDFGALIGGAESHITGYLDYVSVPNAWKSGMETVDYKDVSDAWQKGWNTMDFASFADAWKSGMSTLDYVDPGKWGETAGDWGSSVEDTINGLLSKFQNTDDKEKGSLLDKIGEKLGLDFGSLNDKFPSIDDPANDLSKLDDIADKLGGSSPSGTGSGDLGKIGDDVGKIADSVELTDEDLEYLRKIAEMEWKKEYTTNTIQVDMSNYNTISGENDLDGIVTKLSEKLYEELNIVANGVYA